MEATTPGPVVMIGNATDSDNTLLATNHDAVPIPHMTPDTNPGSMAQGYTFGLFL